MTINTSDARQTWNSAAYHLNVHKLGFTLLYRFDDEIPCVNVFLKTPDVDNKNHDFHLRIIHRLPLNWNSCDLKVINSFIRDVCLKTFEHELDECFLVDGVRVYDPHKDETSKQAP